MTSSNASLRLCLRHRHMDLFRVQQRASRLTFHIRRPGSLNRSGAHLSAMRGDGFSFVGFREYQFGDDVRQVDWNVTARSARPMLRVFLSTHASPLVVVVDASASVRFDAAKWDLTRELSVLFALMALNQADSVAAVSVTDRVESVLPPRGGTAQMHALARWFDAIPEGRRGTRLDIGVLRAMKLLSRSGAVIVVSDFLDSSWDRSIRLAARDHAVVAITIVANREQRLQPMGVVRLRDAESGDVLWVDTHSASVQRAYAAKVIDVRRSIRARLLAAGALPVEVPCDAPYLHSLSSICRVRGEHTS